MKTPTKNPTQAIIDRRKTLSDYEQALQGALGLQENNAKLMRDLEVNSDLGTLGTLSALGRHYVLDRALPVRITECERLVDDASRALVRECNDFIQTILSPRALKARGIVAEKVRKELRPHFPYPPELEARVMQSERVNSFDHVRVSISDNPMGGAKNFAETILQSWERFLKLEAEV